MNSNHKGIKVKGIILAGGSGSRLYPLTKAITKQLLPVYDKPMIYYPLAVLMEMGIHEICIISTESDIPRFEQVLGDGSHLGISIAYLKQEQPNGIAEAFIIAEDFIGEEQVALILGDNIFYGHCLAKQLKNVQKQFSGAAIFGYQVHDPSRYGVIAFDENNQPKEIIEKPLHPPSNYAVTGLYFYDHNVSRLAACLKPSARGELEISDLNQLYLNHKQLQVHLFDVGFAWLDMGTHEALHQAASFVQTVQERQGIQIACLEEISYKNGWITLEELDAIAENVGDSSYGKYMKKIALEARQFSFS